MQGRLRHSDAGAVTATGSEEHAAERREFVLASKLEGTELASFNARSTVRLPALMYGGAFIAFVRKAKGVGVAHGIEAGNVEHMVSFVLSSEF